jgi:isoquinoline 1-oxidoreductase subunit beta
VRVYTTLLGGGFGRRLEVDFIPAAVAASKAVGAPSSSSGRAKTT